MNKYIRQLQQEKTTLDFNIIKTIVNKNQNINHYFNGDHNDWDTTFRIEDFINSQLTNEFSLNLYCEEYDLNLWMEIDLFEIGRPLLDINVDLEDQDLIIEIVMEIESVLGEFKSWINQKIIAAQTDLNLKKEMEKYENE